MTTNVKNRHRLKIPTKLEKIIKQMINVDKKSQTRKQQLNSSRDSAKKNSQQPSQLAWNELAHEKQDNSFVFI